RVFLNAGVFRASVIRERGGHGGKGREDIFVIHNGQLIPIPEPVDRSLADIAVRTIDAAGRVAAVGDLFRIYNYAQREQAGFKWVTIPRDVAMSSAETFDPVAMQSLYGLGLRMAASSDSWATLPPGQRAEP
ncbi:MAG TPA: hypothetical protein VET87_19025, partial [Rubrivivax sp.]|nr:hypothetical protein [Rubrivivax sp.]